MELEQILKEKLQAVYCEVMDESHLHAGHGNFKGQTGSHYRILVVSALFEGKPLVQRHRLVNDTVFQEMPGALHALAMKTYTPDEWANK